MKEELDHSLPLGGKVRIERLSANCIAREKYSILVTECGDGTCYADGLGSVDGDDVLYISKVEDDESLAASIKAAEDWAASHNVPVIYIQPEASDLQT